MTDTSVFEDKKAAYYTLGCKLNFAETSTIGRSLLAQGVRSVRPREVADICVINTCSVTELADKKCRTMIRKAAREHPGSFVVVTGCYAQLSPEEIADIEGVHLVIGSEKKLDIADYLDLERPRDAGASIVRGRTKDIRTFRLSSSSAVTTTAPTAPSPRRAGEAVVARSPRSSPKPNVSLAKVLARSC